jgi:hypothetical protein
MSASLCRDAVFVCLARLAVDRYLTGRTANILQAGAQDQSCQRNCESLGRGNCLDSTNLLSTEREDYIIWEREAKVSREM